MNLKIGQKVILVSTKGNGHVDDILEVADNFQTIKGMMLFNVIKYTGERGNEGHYYHNHTGRWAMLLLLDTTVFRIFSIGIGKYI